MKKNIFIHNKKIQILWFAATMAVCSFLSPAVISAESVTVKNSVSVSSNGGDESSSASIKTTINGTVVEDRQIDSDGEINSYIEVNNGSTTLYTRTTSTGGRDEDQILILIEKLKVLIHNYVLLLNKQP